MSIDTESQSPEPWAEHRDLAELSIEKIRSAYFTRDFSVAGCVKSCLARIHNLQPFLEAILELNPDALSVARQRDESLKRSAPRGRLFGIPVLVKDNIATADRMQTTAGSWALLGSLVERDALVVANLRKEGAIIIGKSNMGEWASLRSSQYSTGYSPRGGQTRNPYNLRKTPKGSSSGSAVAVAAGLVPLSVGTETDTSIIGPASINGVVGFKPTPGFVSREGIIPISINMDSVGTFGRTVADVVLGVDAMTAADDDQALERWLADRNALKGARFGLSRDRCWDIVSEDAKRVASKVFKSMVSAGAAIVHVELPSIKEKVNESGSWDWRHGEPAKSEYTVVKVDAYNGINEYLKSLSKTKIKGIEDILEFNRQSDGTEGATPGLVPAFKSGQDGLEEVVATKGIADEIYHQALAHTRLQTRDNGIDTALRWKPPGF